MDKHKNSKKDRVTILMSFFIVGVLSISFIFLLRLFVEDGGAMLIMQSATLVIALLLFAFFLIDRRDARTSAERLEEQRKIERAEELNQRRLDRELELQRWEEMIKRSDERFEALIRELRRPYRRRR